jgi:hypothetical protein
MKTEGGRMKGMLPRLHSFSFILFLSSFTFRYPGLRLFLDALAEGLLHFCEN